MVVSVIMSLLRHCFFLAIVCPSVTVSHKTVNSVGVNHSVSLSVSPSTHSFQFNFFSNFFLVYFYFTFLFTLFCLMCVFELLLTLYQTFIQSFTQFLLCLWGKCKCWIVYFLVWGTMWSCIIILERFGWLLEGPFRCDLMQVNLLTWADSIAGLVLLVLAEW